ncbi:hypothetical protein HT105_23090, partial [Bacteroides fragilis]|nr:hypothetical protein [Bacteroides fragilis]
DGRDDVAIVRLEMLHPIPFNRLAEAFKAFPNATQVRFVQDEPANQGPWPFYNEHLRELIPDMPEIGPRISPCAVLDCNRYQTAAMTSQSSASRCCIRFRSTVSQRHSRPSRMP